MKDYYEDRLSTKLKKGHKLSLKFLTEDEIYHLHRKLWSYIKIKTRQHKGSWKEGYFNHISTGQEIKHSWPLWNYLEIPQNHCFMCFSQMVDFCGCTNCPISRVCLTTYNDWYNKGTSNVPEILSKLEKGEYL